MPAEYRDFSPVKVPEFDLAAFDESDDCLKLNDTLEEIERLLNADNDSNENDESLSKASSSHSSSSLDTSGPYMMSPNNIISGSFLQTNMRQTPSKIPTKSSYDYKANTPHVGTVSKPVDSASKGQFLIPKNPIHLRTPIKPKTPIHLNKKNIVSPVGLYIKYGPTTPITRRMNSNPQKPSVISRKKDNEENLCFTQRLVQKSPANKGVNEKSPIIPSVVYKPAGNKLYTVNEHLLLPPSIAKMVKESTVVKHEERVVLNARDGNEISKQLEAESDLTKSLISSSLLEQTNHDVSVLASRQAFKK